MRCPECEDELIIRSNNKTGQKFYGCSNFPKCKHTESIIYSDGDPGDTDMLYEAGYPVFDDPRDFF